MSYYAIIRSDSYLVHHGIKGQKWGVRRYQNADGSLTAEGYAHYYGSGGKEMDSYERREWKSAMKKDRNAWKSSAKENYKNAKKRVKTGELSEDSQEYANAKRDKYMAKYGSKKDIDMYRYGSKDQKNAAINSAGGRKAARIATTTAVGTIGGAAVGTAAAAGAVVGGLAIADLVSKIALLGMAGAGTTMGLGAAAVSKGLGNNTERLANRMSNKEYVDADKTIMKRGTGYNTIWTVDKAKIDYNSKNPKEDMFNKLKKDIAFETQSTYDRHTNGKGFVDEDLTKAHYRRIDSEVQNLIKLGASEKEIEDVITSTVANPSATNANNKYGIDYDFRRNFK